MDVIALPLESWYYEDIPLELSDEPAIHNNPLSLTTYSVDQLRTSRYNDVRDLIESEHHLKRLIELKEIREGGVKTLAKFVLDRQQKLSATAAYITQNPVNTDPCQQCNSRKSKGPCKLCIAPGPDYFNGACCNCQFSSTASSCSFYKGASKSKKRRQQSLESEEEEGFDLTADMLKEVSLRDLERWEILIADEKQARRVTVSSNKKRRN